MVSTRFIGDSKFEQSKEEINTTIYDDITSTFSNVNELILWVDLEAVEDLRTTKWCYIFKLEMCLIFQEDNDDNRDIVYLISDYINNTFLKKI
ncbi:MAG: hypothetical protein Q8O62_04485 [Aequorivita sp.]|nr:hypothetical protein [Aequorivita sp.]